MMKANKNFVVQLLRTFLVFALVGACTYAVVVPVGQNCPSYSINSTAYFNVSQMTNMTNNTCQTFENNSCCTMAYTTRFNFSADNITVVESTGAYLTNLSAACRDQLKFVLCGLCAPLQDDFSSFNVAQGDFNFKICTSFCATIYTQCSGATWSVTNKTVSTQWAIYTDFCQEVFSDTARHINAFTASGQCYSPDTTGVNVPPAGGPNFASSIVPQVLVVMALASLLIFYA